MIWAGGGFLLLLISGTPIVLALGIAALVAIELTTTAPISIVAQRVYGGISSFTLMAIPFFVASGLLMEAGGIARRFVNLASALVGWITCRPPTTGRSRRSPSASRTGARIWPTNWSGSSGFMTQPTSPP